MTHYIKKKEANKNVNSNYSYYDGSHHYLSEEVWWERQLIKTKGLMNDISPFLFYKKEEV